ncbi:MAG: zf-HC2 domain-containing protein [Acidobacteriota bacterium]
MKQRDDLTDALEEILVPGVHLEPEEIADYHNGRLSPADERRVQDHLVACRECSELLLDLQNFGDPAFGSHEVLPDRAGEQVWEGVRKEIQPPNVVPFRREKPRAETTRWLRSLAAMLLLSTLALSGWVVSLRGRLETVSSPQANTPVVDLYPTNVVRGEKGTLPVPELAEDTEWITVVLRAPRLSTYKDYGIEVVRANGSVAWRKDGLKPAYSSFSLSLPRDWIGDHYVRLVGIGPQGERTTIGEYALPKGP